MGGTQLRLLMDLEKDASGYRHSQIDEGRITIIGAMPAGMTSGNPTIAVFAETEHGRVVFAETSLSLFLMAADAFKARYGDPRRDDDAKGGKRS
jgi:hypothetical protein